MHAIRRLPFAHAFLALSFVLSLTGCGGGGGGGSTTTPNATATASPTPIPTASPSSTASITAGSTPQTASLAASSGYAGTITIPAAATGSGTSIAAAIQTSVPTGVAAPSSHARSPQSIGVVLSTLAYITIIPATTVSFSATPSLTFTLPSGTSLAAGSSTYVAFYNPSSGSWQTLLGPGTVSGQTVSFAATSTAFTWNGNATYVYALYATAPTVSSLPSGVANVAGNYSGTVTSSGQSGILSLSVVQNGASATGSWGSVDGTGSNISVSGGTVSGTISGSTITGTAKATFNGSCSLTFTATLTGSTLNGSYTGVAPCTGGTFALSPVIVPAVGTYSGTIQDTTNNTSGTLTYTLTQNNVFLSGTYTSVLGGSSIPGVADGVVVGGVTTAGISNLEFLLNPNTGSCLGYATATINVLTGVLAGSYQYPGVTAGCPVDNGTFTMTLQ